MNELRQHGSAPAKYSRAAGGVSLSVAAGMASLIAGIVLLPFILREVGAGTYGVWLILSSVASYLYFSDVGIGSAITHFGSRSRGGQKGPSLSSLLASGLVWSGITCLVVLPFYFLFSQWYVSSWADSVAEQDRFLLVILSLGLLIPLLLRPFGSALIGAGFLTVDRRNQLVGVVIRVGGTLFVCFSDLGIIGIAAAELMALLVPSLLSVLSLHMRGLIKVRRGDVSTATLRVMLGFSFRSFSVNLVGALTLQSGMIIIGLVGSAAEVTYYNAAFRVYSSVRQLLTWTVDPFRPALSRIFAKNRADATRVLTSILLVSLGAGAAASICLIIAAPDLITLWLGDAVPSRSVSVAAQVLLAGLLINMIHIPLAPATDAAGRPGILLVGQILWLILCLGLSFPFAIHFGVVGVALALSLPLIVVEPVMLWLGMRALNMQLKDWLIGVVKPVIIIIAVALVPTSLVGLALTESGTSQPWLITACAFGAATLVSIAAFRKRFGLQKSVSVLNIEL